VTDPPRGPLSGLVVSDASRVLAGPYAPPLLGEHTDEILRERLGHDDGKIASLRAAGVVA